MREKVKKIRGTINESNIWMFAERNNRENRRYKVFKEISQNWRVELGRAVEDRGRCGEVGSVAGWSGLEQRWQEPGQAPKGGVQDKEIHWMAAQGLKEKNSANLHQCKSSWNLKKTTNICFLWKVRLLTLLKENRRVSYKVILRKFFKKYKRQKKQQNSKRSIKSIVLKITICIKSNHLNTMQR